jgi:hypothetical protein
MTLENPHMVRIVRGANSKDKVGLIYTEGSKEPMTLTVVLIGVSLAIHTLLMQIYTDKGRCEFYCIDRLDGSSKIGKSAILSKQPQQLVVDESPESMNVELTFETFDMVETHKV